MAKAKVMNKKQKSCEGWKEWSLFILRLSFGLFFFFSGLPKITALFAGTNPLAFASVPMWLAWIVGIVEVVGGAAIVIGLCAMTAGLLIAVTMLVAIILTQLSPFSARGVFQHLLYIGAAMVLAFSKSTVLGLDMLWKKK